MGDLIHDHDDDRKNFIICCYQNFESDLVDKLSSAGTFESFCDAVTIWINKPHVVNRRLCGSKILYQNSATDTNIDDFFKECLSCSEKYNSDAIHGTCVEEVPPLSSSIGATFYFVIREIFHKQCSQFSTKEAIIMDFQNKMVNFIPLNGQGKKETVNEYDNDTETSKNVAIQYQICFTEESGKSWIALNTPRKVDASEKSYVDWLRTNLLRKLVNWSSEKKLRTSITSLRLVPVDRFGQRKQILKNLYMKMLQLLPTCW